MLMKHVRQTSRPIAIISAKMNFLHAVFNTLHAAVGGTPFYFILFLFLFYNIKKKNRDCHA